MLRVLIIEDDPDTARFFKAVLDLIGFDSQIATTARDAFNTLTTYVPDMILLDMRLGTEIGGQEILYQVRANNRFDHTKVIVVTAYPILAEHVVDLADLILVKPVDVEQIKTFLERFGNFEVRPRHLQFRDPVTDLYNAEFFQTRLELAFERARRRIDFHYGVILISIHLQHREPETVVYEVRTAILKQVAQRLRQNLRPTDTLAHLNNWKVAALAEELASPEDIRLVAIRLHNMLEEPFSLGGEIYEISTQIGVATHKPHDTSAITALEQAEKALLEASHAGGSTIQIY
jgi:diguanylate cyclase (GGDEF)-like protein